jgi:AcrR family transcriptional regulator
MSVTEAPVDTRTRILEATARCIAADGVAAVRMATIARAAGVSTALLHYHFDTKEHLFEQVFRHSYTAATVLDQEEMRAAGRSPAQRLAAYLDRCLPSDDELAHDWLLWQELGLMSLRQPALAAVNADLKQGDVDRVSEIIRDGLADGSFHDVDAATVAQAALALCDGLGVRVLSDDPHTTLHTARAIVATTIGSLVGSEAPLPLPGVTPGSASSAVGTASIRPPREASR